MHHQCVTPLAFVQLLTIATLRQRTSTRNADSAEGANIRSPSEAWGVKDWRVVESVKINGWRGFSGAAAAVCNVKSVDIVLSVLACMHTLENQTRKLFPVKYSLFRQGSPSRRCGSLIFIVLLRIGAVLPLPSSRIWRKPLTIEYPSTGEIKRSGFSKCRV